MILSGHQPNYWPYPGLIGKIMKSDSFIYVTKVQFEKKSWQKRNRLRTKEGWTYIQVPTITKGLFNQNICDVLIDNSTDWKAKHKKMIELLYGKAPYYGEHKALIDKVYSMEWTKLSELDIYIMNYILEYLDSDTRILYDNDFDFTGHKTEMLVDMVKRTGCDTYLSNLGSQAYVEIEAFTNAGYHHQYINYVGKEYKQMYPGFEEGLSILDMLMNCGKEETKAILQNNDNYEFSEIDKRLIRTE